MEKKFIRTLVMVDAPVLDEDRNNGGKSVGSNGGGGGSNSGRGLRSAIMTNTPFPQPAPVWQRRHYNAIIAGGGGSRLNPREAAA